jgi:hypothetical protein
LINKIQEFAVEIGSTSLCQAFHQPEKKARPSCCFQNVWDKVDRDDGNILYGWTFNSRINAEYGEYLIATHHAVWRAPDNKLIDVTPFTDEPKHHPIASGNYILFLVDELAHPVGNGIVVAPLPLKFFALSDSLELKSYLAKLSEQEQKACQDIYDGNVNLSQVSSIFFQSQ